MNLMNSKGKTASVKRLVFSSALYNKHEQYIYIYTHTHTHTIQQHNKNDTMITNIQYNNKSIHDTTIKTNDIIQQYQIN